MNWDIGTNWFNSRGLHRIKNPPEGLENNLDFQNGIQLCIAYEMIDFGQISAAIAKCQKVATEVSKRIQDPSFKAHIYNKFAWLCSLINENNICRSEIIDLASQAVNINPKSGNYKDTLAITIMFHPNFDIDPMGKFDEGENKPIENPYKDSIKLLKQALECDDFKKLALPNMAKIRQRRNDWINSLESRINPLDYEMISLLLKEEY